MSTTTAIDATIRAARLDDYEGVCRLMAVADALHQERLPWLFSTPSGPSRSEANFADQLKREDSAVFVADTGTRAGCQIVLRPVGRPAFPHRFCQSYS